MRSTTVRHTLRDIFLGWRSARLAESDLMRPVPPAEMRENR
jgi:hypothetical protein